MSSRPPSAVPLSEPLYGATLPQAVRRFFAKYAVFSGRAGRAEYWWWALVGTVVALTLEVVRFVLLGANLSAYLAHPPYELRRSSLPLLLWFAAVFVPTQALGVRRLHDTNRSGWWQLLSIAATIASMVQLRFPMAAVPFAGIPAPTGFGRAIAAAAAIVSFVASITLVVLYLGPPNPAGRRFDRRR